MQLKHLFFVKGYVLLSSSAVTTCIFFKDQFFHCSDSYMRLLGYPVMIYCLNVQHCQARAPLWFHLHAELVLAFYANLGRSWRDNTGTRHHTPFCFCHTSRSPCRVVCSTLSGKGCQCSDEHQTVKSHIPSVGMVFHHNVGKA